MSLDLDDLLAKTSRTFALAIPMLPEPTRKEVTIAYLLFRVADTFEDATTWPRTERIAALNEFADALRDFDLPRLETLTKKWVAKPPVDHAGYMELLAATPEVVGVLNEFTESARAILIKHAVRTARGMADVVARADERGNLELATVPELQHYCYIVAGIVGELLTDLFLNDSAELAKVRDVLEGNAIAFGEGLQLVNILKDSGADAKDGRVYLPKNVSRTDIIELAGKDLDGASRYIDALQRGGAPSGYLGFTGISVMLARAALKALATGGPGTKVSRQEVARLLGELTSTLETGASMLQATA
jgi:farnesyl-diphosphate farnesyltransferase